MVTKGKGNKPQVKQIEVSAESGIAVRTKERQRQEEASRKALKDRILEADSDDDSERSFE